MRQSTRQSMYQGWLSLVLLLCALPCAAAPTRAWTVEAQYPHDPTHFTQGLALHNGQLIETTGLYGQSAIYVKDLKTGHVLHGQRLPPMWFGEGVTVWRNRAVMLTWRERIAQWFDLSAERLLAPLDAMRYGGEGWGITSNDTHLITSDGSAELRFRSAEDFSVQRILTVRDDTQPVTMLNELEWARGTVIANVWQTDRIALIDPASGKVSAWLDLAPLKTRFDKPRHWNATEHVLNGIAFDDASGLLYVTGKCWPALFALKVDGWKPVQ